MNKLKYDTSKWYTNEKRCNSCLDDFTNGQQIIRYTEIIKDSGDYFGEYDYYEYEKFFCSNECMLNYIINGDNVRHFELELYDSENKENLKIINGISNDIRNIKCGVMKTIHDIEIFTFEKDGCVNYLLNNVMYGKDVDGVIKQVIRILRHRGVVK